ncbi:MAG: hypothetical protein K2X08_02455, partial [Chlamydiales bacterium]|nr:hypothetical protein [Chlamydiales bacterium]
MEIVIGLALLASLLSILLSFFTSSAKMDVKLEKAKDALLQRQHLTQRLQSLFTSMIPSRDGDALYTKIFPKETHASLIVYFDHGIDPDPAFSGPSLGRIFIDKQNQLCLAVWPKEREKKQTSVRFEVLLQDVYDAKFHFLTKKSNQSIGWEDERPEKEKEPIPCLIRLDLWQQEDKK